MKQILSFLFAIAFFFTISINAFAHSHLEESTPENKETVTTPTSEIVLSFDGKIEIGSSIDVTNSSGNAIDVKDLIIGDGTLTATFAEPLANDDYKVNYSIISADGHPVDGDFKFTVDVENNNSTNASSTSTDQTLNTTTDDNGSNVFWYVALSIIIIIAAIFVITKRKKQ